MKPVTLLSLMRLVSPSLPIGAYAYSQGLEWAVGSGAVKDEATLEGWLKGLLHNGLATFDLPVLRQMHEACERGDSAAALELSKELIAWRDSREARLEERQMGLSLARILVDAGVRASEPYVRNGQATYMGMFALACADWGISREDCLLAYCWAWAENQVLAGIKLIPLGQSAGQRILGVLMEEIPVVIQKTGTIGYNEWFSTTPGRSMAQLRHERQDVRLFRS